MSLALYNSSEKYHPVNVPVGEMETNFPFLITLVCKIGIFKFKGAVTFTLKKPIGLFSIARMLPIKCFTCVRNHKGTQNYIKHWEIES